MTMQIAIRDLENRQSANRPTFVRSRERKNGTRRGERMRTAGEGGGGRGRGQGEGRLSRQSRFLGLIPRN